jgi:8-oxo-dGTP pyrophosphatase MutT (NUDIX family)
MTAADTAGPVTGIDGPPEWLTRLAATVSRDGLPFRPEGWPAPPPSARPAAVLVLFGPGEHGPELLLLERSADLRKHAGQPAFPGGGADPTDGSPAATALREATEEVGLDPSGVDILGHVSPPLYLPHSNYLVTPVLAWWRSPSPVHPVDPAETSVVVQVAVADLVNPANRMLLRHPRTFQPSPAFHVTGLTTVWGFTAGVLDAMLRIAGLERPWGDGPPVEDAAVNASIALAARAGALADLEGAGEIDPGDLVGGDHEDTPATGDVGAQRGAGTTKGSAA